MKMFGVSKSILLLIIVVTPFSGRVQDSLIGHVEMYAFFYPNKIVLKKLVSEQILHREY